MPSYVKTRFCSLITLLSLALEYRKVFSECFSGKLSKYALNDSHWQTLQVLHDSLKSVLSCCVLNQSRDHWSLSDGLYSIIKVVTESADAIKKIEEKNPNIESDFQSSDGVLLLGTSLLEIDIRRTVLDTLLPHLNFLKVFDASKAHCFLALLLDPRYKRFGFMSKLRGLDDSFPCPKRFAALKSEYLEKSLFPLLHDAYCQIRGWYFQEIVREHESQLSNNMNTRVNTAARARTPFETEQDYCDYDCDDSAELANVAEPKLHTRYTQLLQECKSQWIAFETAILPDPFRSWSIDDLSKHFDPIAWWKHYESSFPALACVARHILSIPASQAEVERVFSIAGVIMQARRSRLGIGNLGNMIQIIKNWVDAFTSRGDNKLRIQAHLLNRATNEEERQNLIRFGLNITQDSSLNLSSDRYWINEAALEDELQESCELEVSTPPISQPAVAEVISDNFTSSTTVANDKSNDLPPPEDLVFLDTENFDLIQSDDENDED